MLFNIVLTSKKYHSLTSKVRNRARKIFRAYDERRIRRHTKNNSILGAIILATEIEKQVHKEGSSKSTGEN